MYLELTDISKKLEQMRSSAELHFYGKGKVYGLQGKNGCGKSMLMRVICGLVLPTVGEVKIDGKNSWKRVFISTKCGCVY